MKTLIALTGFVLIMAINPLLAAIYASTVLVVAAAWYISKGIYSLFTYSPRNETGQTEHPIGYESMNSYIANPQGQTDSTVFYGSKHAVCDKPYQHQNGQTGPPES